MVPEGNFYSGLGMDDRGEETDESKWSKLMVKIPRQSDLRTSHLAS
jgi:hypothetical protein